MAEEPFSDFFGVLGRLLRVGRARRDEIATELRDHLEERLAELTEMGVPQREAIARALAEFGDAAELAAQFVEIVRNRQRRWIMRCTMGAMVAASVLVVAGLSLWPDSQPSFNPRATAQEPKPPAASEVDENAKVEAALNKRISIEFIETPLGDVIDFIAEAAGVQLHAKWRTLGDVDVTPDSPITLNLKQVSARMILELVLDQINDGLAFSVQEGLVLISTEQDFASKLVVQVYDVRDLIDMGEPMVAGASDPFGGGMGGGGMHGAVGPLMQSPSANLLVATINQAISPQRWAETAPSTFQRVDDGGSVMVYRGLLVVKKPPSIQSDIVALLTMLRAAEAKASAQGKAVKPAAEAH